MTRILAAGDRFIRASLFRAALEKALGSHTDIAELELPWPDEPFGQVAEVTEASGSEDELIAALEGSTAIVTQLAPLTRRVLEASPDLKLIAVSRGGPVNVNTESALELGIQVVNVPGRNGIATAEMSVGLALALLRRIPLAHSSMLDHQWRGDLYRWNQVGQEAAASVIGLVGAGAVGMHVAKVFNAIGADVVVYDPYLPQGSLKGIARQADSLPELFRQCNLISVHARLTPETENVVNADLLSLMPAGGYLVNAARGGLVNYDDVADLIEKGELAGAAFDVYPQEPVDFHHRLFQLAQQGYDVVVTPHIAGASRETAQRAVNGVAEEVRRFIASEAPLNPVVDSSTTKRTGHLTT